ncbi:MAG: PLP-dependent aminotransferase family protein [Dehalococcoidia bacterium]
MTRTHDAPAETERRWTSTAVDDLLTDWARNAGGFASDFSRVYPADAVVFGAGIPDPDTLPWEQLAAAARRVLEQDAPGALRYGGLQGDVVLRQWIADRLNQQEDAGVGPDNFLLTNGSGQAIQMISSAFIQPGTAVLVERPSYSAAMRTFRSFGGRLTDVAMDHEGVLPEALEQAIDRLVAEGRAPRLFYTMPTLQNPTGTTTSVPRRESVVEICDRHGILIVEDDAYGEIRVEGSRPPSYYKVAGGQGVLRLSTFSKMAAAGLRIGWMTGRPDFVSALTRLRYDSGLSPFLIRTVAEFCSSGDQDRHLATMIPIYREKRDRLAAALTERCAQHGTWTVPEGGFFLWMTLADQIDPDTLTEALEAEKVVVQRDTNFFAEPSERNHLRLCFSFLNAASIEEGVQRLGRALDRSVR